MIKRIHVNQHKIKSNTKHNKSDPVVTVKTSNDNYYGNRVEIEGPCTIKTIYDDEDNKMLPCGARVWIETQSLIILYDGDAKITLP